MLTIDSLRLPVPTNSSLSKPTATKMHSVTKINLHYSAKLYSSSRGQNGCQATQASVQANEALKMGGMLTSIETSALIVQMMR